MERDQCRADQGQGRGECGLSAVVVGMACCSGCGKVVGSWVSMAPPRNLVCPQLLLPRWWRLSRGWSLVARLGGVEDPERRGPWCLTTPRVLPNSGDPHLAWLAGNRGPSTAGSSTAHPQHIPWACSALGCWGWRPCQSSECSQCSRGTGFARAWTEPGHLPLGL